MHGANMTSLRRLLMINSMGQRAEEYTATGNPAVFETNLTKSLRQLLIPFSPVQSGTGDPSPTNVRPITGYSGVNVTRTGTNVWDEQWENGTFNVSTGVNINSGDALNQIRSKNPIPVVAGKEYFVKAPSGIWAIFIDKNGSVVEVPTSVHARAGKSIQVGGNANVDYDKFIAPPGCSYVKFYCQAVYGSTYEDNISINYPSTETDYHAGSSTTIPVVFPAVGKNLLNESAVTVGKAIGETGNIADSTLGCHTDYMPVEEGETYTFSGLAGYNGIYRRRIHGYDAQGEWVEQLGVYESSRTLGQSFSKSVTIPSGVSSVRISFCKDDTNPQFEKGSSATTYEPFTNTVYGGTLDATTGTLTVTHGIADLGNTSWGADPNRPGVFYGSISGRASNSQVGACSDYKTSNINVSTADDYYISGRASYGSGYIFVRDTRYASSTWAEFKTAVTGVKVIYELAESRVFHIDPVTIQTLIGDNAIWSDTNGENTIKYLKKG